MPRFMTGSRQSCKGSSYGGAAERDAYASPFRNVLFPQTQQQELPQPLPQPLPHALPQLLPQLLPPKPPQQHSSRTMMMIHHRQEQSLFPLLKHMIVTSLFDLQDILCFTFQWGT